ncbi:hypothetical protein ABIE65_005043 [Constrictibacter sp. MBR-5]|jgi:hypothetical protein|uniref:hypothetical protein n=1 Tax=Constrictibacter sp. MBR-5 TaxID=3156467 RepID=UPI0033961E76
MMPDQSLFMSSIERLDPADLDRLASYYRRLAHHLESLAASRASRETAAVRGVAYWSREIPARHAALVAAGTAHDAAADRIAAEMHVPAGTVAAYLDRHARAAAAAERAERNREIMRHARAGLSNAAIGRLVGLSGYQVGKIVRSEVKAAAAGRKIGA